MGDPAPAANAYTLAEQIKDLIEDSMANVSQLNRAIDTIMERFDHPAIDTAIEQLDRFYSNNAAAHANLVRLQKAVRGKKVLVKG